MNCPKCKSVLILLQEGFPNDDKSNGDHWWNLWGCRSCDVVFPEQLSQRCFSDKREREKGLDFCFKIREKLVGADATLTKYFEIKSRQDSGELTREELCIIWPHLGTRIYVPSEDGFFLGGLANVLEQDFCDQDIKGGMFPFGISVREHPGKHYRWEEIAPMQKRLEAEFGQQTARVEILDKTIPKVGDMLYLDTKYERTDFYENESSEGYKRFPDLSADAVVPHIFYLKGGRCSVVTIIPKQNPKGEVDYYIQTQITPGKWYKWSTIKTKQSRLKKKFGEALANFICGESVRPNEYAGHCLKLFGFVPKNKGRLF